MLKITEEIAFNFNTLGCIGDTVRSGETLIFETKDCFNNQLTSEEQKLESLNWNCINPATGPVFIENCEPGDVLKIQIKDIQTDEYGTMAAIPENNTVFACVSKRCPSGDGRCPCLYGRR